MRKLQRTCDAESRHCARLEFELSAQRHRRRLDTPSHRGGEPMPSIFDPIRRGASKAAFEADRMLRVNRVQAAIDALRSQIGATTMKLGTDALGLHRSRGLQEAELTTVCQGILEMEEQIRTRQREIDEIKREVAPGDAVAAHPTYGHLCPKCKIELAPEAAFCTRCGAAAVDITPPSASQTASSGCPKCQTEVPPGAIFCPNCGARR